MQLRRILGPPAVVLLAFAVPPAALAANVSVRIEGQGTTLLPRTQVTTPAADVHGDGSCPGNTLAGAVQAATGGNWDRAPGGFSTVILGETHTFSDGKDSDYWAGWVNDKYGDAFCSQTLQDGDDVLVTPDTTDNATFASAVFPLRIAGVPAVVPRGGQVEVRATEFRNYVGQPTFGTPGTGDPQPSTGVRVTGGGANATTGQDGKVTVVFTEAGPATLRAVKPVTSPDGGAFAMRAVPQAVCVDDGAGSCGGVAVPGGPPAGGPGGPVAAPPPYRPPVPQILSIARRARFAAKDAPRELRGRVNLGTEGLSSVRLRLERRAGGRCQYFSSRVEEFRGARCGKGWSFAIGDRAEWSYLLPEALAPGRYELDVLARDRTGQQRTEAVVFYVRKGGVQVFVVGRTKVLSEPVEVSARAASVKVAGRKCRIADGTPLAALEALRLRRGPAYTLRDFGSCSRRVADAGGLFVSKLGPDSNRGSAGWVYKVGRKVGSTSAADASGPFGTGQRLRTGDAVTWFWCVRASDCQRTLEVSGARTVSPGAPLVITVSGYDDQGKGGPVTGASVSFAGRTALTGKDGKATVAAPPSGGRYEVVAAKKGTVRSRPMEVVVQ